VQSGNSLQVNKFEVDSSDDKLNSQAVYINVCGKFCDMTAMASRTLLVDPSEEQKNAYVVAYEALDTLIQALKPGQPIKNAYMAAKNLVMQKNADLIVTPNFGFGIGFNYKERLLAITPTNETLVEPGMTFHARISISGISKEQARSILAIGDTVLVTPDSAPNKVLTVGISRAYAEISYSLDESADEKEPAKPPAAKEKKPAQAARTDSTRKSAKKRASDDDDYSGDEDAESGEEGSKEILKAGQTMEFRASRLRSKAAE